MRLWFLLAGVEPDKLKQSFISFYFRHDFPNGMALWKWKNSYWICSPEKYKHDIMVAFTAFNVVEFSSAPSSADIEFMYGDIHSLKNNI